MSTIILCFLKISCFRSIALHLQCKYGYIPHILGKTGTFTAQRYRQTDRYILGIRSRYAIFVYLYDSTGVQNEALHPGVFPILNGLFSAIIDKVVSFF